jgi:hypothetical protein
MNNNDFLENIKKTMALENIKDFNHFHNSEQVLTIKGTVDDDNEKNDLLILMDSFIEKKINKLLKKHIHQWEENIYNKITEMEQKIDYKISYTNNYDKTQLKILIKELLKELIN